MNLVVRSSVQGFDYIPRLHYHSSKLGCNRFNPYELCAHRLHNTFSNRYFSILGGNCAHPVIKTFHDACKSNGCRDVAEAKSTHSAGRGAFRGIGSSCVGDKGSKRSSCGCCLCVWAGRTRSWPDVVSREETTWRILVGMVVMLSAEDNTRQWVLLMTCAKPPTSPISPSISYTEILTTDFTSINQTMTRIRERSLGE